jgi:hypothetical protein
VYDFRRYAMGFTNTAFGHSFGPIKNITTLFPYILRLVLKLLSVHTYFRSTMRILVFQLSK